MLEIRKVPFLLFNYCHNFFPDVKMVEALCQKQEYIIKEDMEKHLKKKINVITWRFGVILSPLSNADLCHSVQINASLGVKESR